MKTNNRFINQIKSYYKSIAINSFRLWLTIIGITTGVILLVVSTVILESYENAYYDEFKLFTNEYVYVSNNNGFSQEDMLVFNNELDNELITYSTNEFYSENKYQLNIKSSGISSNYINNSLIDKIDYSVNNAPVIYNPKLIIGKTWDIEDYQNKNKIVVINLSLAKLLFNDKNPIGESIVLNDTKFEIIGVLDNSPSQLREIETYNNISANNNLSQSEIEKYFPSLNVYMPITTFIEFINPNAKINRCLIKSTEEVNSIKIVSNFQDYYKNELLLESTNTIRIFNKDLIDQVIEENFSSIKIVIICVTIFFILLATIIIANTLFYSIKEKITEIGIRKAMGATKSDIMLQVTFEGIFYMVLSIIFALCISFIIILGLFIFLEMQNIYLLVLKVNFYNIVIIAFALIIISIIASIFPGIYASNMKIVDAVKFE